MVIDDILKRLSGYEVYYREFGRCWCLICCCDVMEFLKVLDDECVDLVVADPPYNSKVEWDGKNDEWQFLWLNETKRVMKEGASFYMFFAPLTMYGVEGWVRRNLTLKNVIVWYHPNLYGVFMSYGDDRYKSTWDAVFYAVKGKKAKHGKKVAQVAYSVTGRGFDVMVYPQPRPLLHKAQKPLELVRKFVLCSSNEGDVVLDPFVGVGTTAIVCRELGRNFLGCEIEKKFFDIAVKRLEWRGDLKAIDWEIKEELKELEKREPKG